MNVLLIKMSSMGDLIHTLPAITDASQQIPDLCIDWVVEPAYADIARWHSHVNQILPLPLRYWRNHFWKKNNLKNIFTWIQQIRSKKYDIILDAQGLIKSGLVTLCARGERSGLNWYSAKEKIVSCIYQKRYSVDPLIHAIERNRSLFAQALGYKMPQSTADYKIELARLPLSPHISSCQYLVFLHGTTRINKEWPELYWKKLLSFFQQSHLQIIFPWSNELEHQRAKRIVDGMTNAVILNRSSIAEMAALFANAKAVISVDSGLSHLAAALNTPSLVLYGSTDTNRIGTQGKCQHHLTAKTPSCSPCHRKQCYYPQTKKNVPACMLSLSPEIVYQHLENLLLH